MPTYMVLVTFTDECVKSPGEIPGGIEMVHSGVAQMGGRVIACYALMGEYDAVGIYEMPSDEAVVALSLRIASTGMARTKTYRAIPHEQFSQIIQQMPS